MSENLVEKVAKWLHHMPLCNSRGYPFSYEYCESKARELLNLMPLNEIGRCACALNRHFILRGHTRDSRGRTKVREIIDLCTIEPDEPELESYISRFVEGACQNYETDSKAVKHATEMIMDKIMKLIKENNDEK